MRKWTRFILTGCLAVSLAAAGAVTALAETAAYETSQHSPIRVYGTAAKMEGNRLHLTNSNPNDLYNDIIVNTENARILDATTGMPVSFDDLTEGETVYAYIGQAVTLSLPPIANAEIVLAKIPADYKVPAYAVVSDLEMHEDGSAVLTTTSGEVFQVPADCTTLPYLTRNMVYISSFTPGSTCLIWSDDSNNAYRMMQFARSFEEGDGDTVQRLGWSQTDEGWVYYNADGQLQKGWLEEDGEWYYLDPDTGIMQTGFVTVNGKTYYLLSDGKMLTKPLVFTPAEDGSLQ